MEYCLRDQATIAFRTEYEFPLLIACQYKAKGAPHDRNRLRYVRLCIRPLSQAWWCGPLISGLDCDLTWNDGENRYHFDGAQPCFPPRHRTSLKLAVISDLHADDSQTSYNKIQLLVDQVTESQPDFILLLGDYTQHPDSINSEPACQRIEEIACWICPHTNARVPGIMRIGHPRTVVTALTDNGIKVSTMRRFDRLRRAVSMLSRPRRRFTDRLRYVDFPAGAGLPKITLTHDPAGAFHPDVEGVVFAGHTHCGQIRLPIIGSPWIPSEAPNDATCGLYEDADRFLWVSSGVGTSILPVRLGAQSQWDLIEMRAPNCWEGCPGKLNTWHQNELCLQNMSPIAAN